MAIRWSPRASNVPPPRIREDAADGEALRRRADVRSQLAEAVDHGLDPVGLLRAQLGGAAERAVSVCVHGEQGEERQLVDEHGTSAALMVAPTSSDGRMSRSPAGSPPIRQRLKTVMFAPIRSSTVRRPVRRGFRLTPWIVSSEPASSVPATTNGAAAEKSPGISTSPSSSLPSARR